MPRLSKIGAAALGAFGWTTGGASVTADFLVIAGGGGASCGDRSGGAGAGGYRCSVTGESSGGGASAEGKLSLNPLLSYTVIVGAGGAGGNTSGTAANGSDSVFSTVTSTGGGESSIDSVSTGFSGGSGGGGGGDNGRSGGSGTANQGFAGGTGASGFSNNGTGGGGGGAGALGVNGATSGVSGTGGAGVASSITGSSVTRAGGGGGGTFSGTAGVGGSGGGGNGGTSSANGGSGAANTGSGGGGGGTNSGNGGSGGSGVVIISYLGAQKFGGGVVTSSGGYTIHTFNTSGTLAPIASLSASYLIVAGGGGGGGPYYGGGGGAGGLLSGSGLTIDTNSTYVITVGSGGAGGATGSFNNFGTNGTNSSFSVYATASVGGGGGASRTSVGNTNTGNSGGSGGGGAVWTTTNAGGAGTSGQGYAGGSATSPYGSGGGGGAGAVGVTSSTSGQGGNGGVGLANPISGSTAGQLVSSTYYLAGGGGGAPTSGTASSGGSGGGGASSSNTGGGVSGTSNTGGGGGGGSGYNDGSASFGGAGGSGVVIISYAGDTQQMAGGTVTISGGNVIHTFTSSGYLAPLKLVNNSLRFRASAAAYLSRTPIEASTSVQKATFSFWVKRGALGIINSINNYVYAVRMTGSQYFYIGFGSTDTFDVLECVGSIQYNVVTSRKFRDPAAWYHITVSIDTTQTTDSNRIKIYVNGQLETSFGTASYPSVNYNHTYLGTTSYIHSIGWSGNNGVYSGAEYYLSEFNFVDGQALTPNAFGTSNSYGVWQPITYGGSYGKNGFYLPFTNKTSTTTLGYDFSPNGNNWTPNNLSLTTGITYDSMTDVPTLTSANTANYCVLNPLSALNSSTTADGNLKGTLPAASVTTDIYGTMASGTTGKFYWETTYVSRSGNSAFAIGLVKTLSSGYPDTTSTGGVGYYSVNGVVYVDGSSAATYATFTTSDVIGIALDLTNSQVSFYKQTSGTGSFALQGTVSIASGNSWTPSWNNGTTSGNQVYTANFGQQPFNNSSPPSGFVALNTYNI